MTQNSLFKKSKAPRQQPLNEMRHEYVFVESSEELKANASAWNFVSVGGGFDTSRRWAAYRAYQLAGVAELDDSTKMSKPPLGAVYYPWRVYLGHAYEEVVSGNSREFNMKARAQFLVFGGSIEGFARQQGLQNHSVGRGLRPASGQAIFAKTPEQIHGAYVAEGPPVPIIVEYRQIPGTAFDPSRIPWEAPLTAVVRFTQLNVADDGSWDSTPWVLTATCRVNDRDVPVEQPQVWSGKVDDEKNPYPLQWSTRYDVLPGDTLSCGTSGMLEDVMTSPQPAGSGAMPPVVVQPGLHTQGAFEAKNAKASYSVQWTMEVSGTAPAQ
jgi:hypothetical protein